MPLAVVRRKQTGKLYISGTIAGQRVFRRAQSDRLAAAREEAALAEAQLLRTAWHGERSGVRSFDEALVSYLEAQTRRDGERARLTRIRNEIGGDCQLADINQDTAVRLRRLLKPGAADATFQREILTPLNAVLRYAADMGWCDQPRFRRPKAAQGRTLFMTPDEVERLLAHAAPHLQPLLTFLVGTGARMSEALELEWKDVDLKGHRCTLWRTKNGKARTVELPSRVELSLAALFHRDGAVFRKADNTPWVGRDRGFGGQIKTAWAGALRRAGLDPNLTPHDCRHTFATWHWALQRDIVALCAAGGWSSLTLVQRYTHLMKEGCEASIRAWLGEHPAQESAA
jgi:integrase